MLSNNDNHAGEGEGSWGVGGDGEVVLRGWATGKVFIRAAAFEIGVRNAL